MSSGIGSVVLVMVIGVFITGMLGNGFNVLVNCIDWVNSQKLLSAGCNLTCLAISRISLLWITSLDSSVMVLWPHLYAIGKLENFIRIFWTMSDHPATWFASYLSVFYVFKIANFSQPCFACLTWRTGRMLLVLSLGSFFLLFFNVELSGRLSHFWINVYETDERNSTWSSNVGKTLYLNVFIVCNFICLIPFLMPLTSLLLLFLSLMRHTRTMKLNSSSGDFSTEAHKRVMKMVMSFLVLFTLHVSSILLTGCFPLY